MDSTAVLLIDCPDRPGLVARVASLLYKHGANILHADQHQDHELGLFFMRVEWALALETGNKEPREQGTEVVLPSTNDVSGLGFDLARFEHDFARIAEELQM